MLLPVQTDYDHRLSFAEQTSNNLSCKEVAALPVEAQLKKGYHRVSIVLPIYDHQPNTTKRTGCTIFDVVIHMKEAYLLPVVLELDSKDITLLPFNDDNSEFHQGSILSGYEIVDYSEGWQHSLIAIKGLESTS